MEDIKNLMEKIKKKKEAKQKLNDYELDDEFEFLIDEGLNKEYEEKQKLEKELRESVYPTFYKKHMKTIEKITTMFFDTLEFSFEEIIEELFYQNATSFACKKSSKRQKHDIRKTKY